MGNKFFPTPEDCAIVCPYQLHLSPDGRTMYTYAAYDVNGTTYHGIGTKPANLMYDEEEFLQTLREKRNRCAASNDIDISR